MCLLIETIRVVDGQFQNMYYHNARLNRSRKELFGSTDTIDIASNVKIPIDVTKGVYRCTVTYNKAILDVKFIPYSIKNISNLKLVIAANIDYGYKYADRSMLNDLLVKREECDEILIVKNGRITDTSFTNVVFYNGNKWLTPADPLLRGTKRQALLDKGVIQEMDIGLSDINNFEKISLINAMLDLGDIVINTDQIS